MHPPRPSVADERPKATDRLADWLLTHVPLSTVALLTMLIVRHRVDLDAPILILGIAVLIDMGINVLRWRRRVKHSSPVIASEARDLLFRPGRQSRSLVAAAPRNDVPTPRA